MKNGTVQVICGSGKGKTSMALGLAISALAEQKRVIMIQFLKGSLEPERMDVLMRLEPDLKVFRFEKSPAFFEHLSEEEKKEEERNIHNGLNFAKKVMARGGCDVLILDEILGIVDCGIMTAEDLVQNLKAREKEMSVILTGLVFPSGLENDVDAITTIQSKDVK